MSEWVVIYQYPGTAIIRPKKSFPFRAIGFALLAVALGGFFGPFIPMLRLETSYAVTQVLPTPTPPPITNEFRLVIPKIGVNAPIIANVNPTNYTEALKTGVAHSSTSFFPDQNGTVYLFSHSTNYDWFVEDLNAVFYLLKNLEVGDEIVMYYQGKQYTYILREKRVVKPSEISYLVPQSGKKSLILQTCWPPGSTAQRLLLFADLTEL